MLGITENGATPVFIEPDEFYNMDASKIEEAITEKTKVILAALAFILLRILEHLEMAGHWLRIIQNLQNGCGCCGIMAAR